MAIGTASALLLLFVVLVVGSVLRARRRGVVTGREGLVGAMATVRRPISPAEAGLIHVQGELWRATAGDAEVPRGGRVVVQGMDGLILRVRPLDSEHLEPTDDAPDNASGAVPYTLLADARKQ